MTIFGEFLFVFACSLVQAFAAYCPIQGYTKYADNAISSDVTPFLSPNTSLDFCRTNSFVQHKATFFSYENSGVCNFYRGTFQDAYLVSSSSSTVGVICTLEIGQCGRNGMRTSLGMRYSSDNFESTSYNGYPPRTRRNAGNWCRNFAEGKVYSVETTGVLGGCYVYRDNFNASLLEPNSDEFVVEVCDSAGNCGLEDTVIHKGMHYTDDYGIIRSAAVLGFLGNFSEAFATCRAKTREQYLLYPQFNYFYRIIISHIDYICRAYLDPFDGKLLEEELSIDTTFPCLPGCSYAGFKEYRGKRVKSWVRRNYRYKGTGTTQSSCENLMRFYKAEFYALVGAENQQLLCDIYLLELKDNYLEDSDDEDALIGVYCGKSYD